MDGHWGEGLGVETCSCMRWLWVYAYSSLFVPPPGPLVLLQLSRCLPLTGSWWGSPFSWGTLLVCQKGVTFQSPTGCLAPNCPQLAHQ